jgi:hypothetical protein
MSREDHDSSVVAKFPCNVIPGDRAIVAVLDAGSSAKEIVPTKEGEVPGQPKNDMLPGVGMTNWWNATTRTEPTNNHKNSPIDKKKKKKRNHPPKPPKAK